MNKTTQRNNQSGFSLLELSIVLSILAIVIAGALPFLTETSKSKDADDTMKRMAAIEEALATFYVEYDKLPCPSDPGAEPDTTGFGKAFPNTDCTGPRVASSGTARGGGVPVRDLGLPDEYAFDGWGRKFSYHLDNRAASDKTFNQSGALIVKDANGNMMSSAASYVLISHGPNGHGGYTSGDNVRYDAGSTSVSEAENCNSGVEPCSGGYNSVFIKSNPHYNIAGDDSSLYDDIVRYRPAVLIKNALGGTPLWDDYGQHIATTNLGNVGIGTNAPRHKLQISGGVQASYFNNSSDATLKSDVKTAQGLELIRQLHGVSYVWKDSGKPGMGVIAQEVEKVMPQAVTTDPDTGLKSVEYNQLIAPLIEAVKELQAENAALKAEIEALKAGQASH